jgi:paraquat-inducible protein B
VKPGAVFPLLARPPAPAGAADGREFVLIADRLGSISATDPVYYRDTRVGAVSGTELLPDGTAVAITIAIEERHAALVRERSVFWNASGIHADLSLLHPELDVESLKALLAGGVAFATPPTAARPPRQVRSSACTAKRMRRNSCSRPCRDCTSCLWAVGSAPSRSATRSTTARSRSAR